MRWRISFKKCKSMLQHNLALAESAEPLFSQKNMMVWFEFVKQFRKWTVFCNKTGNYINCTCIDMYIQAYDLSRRDDGNLYMAVSV